MKNVMRSILAILLVVVCSAAALAADSVDITPSSLSFIALPGQSMSADINITNTGTTTLNFNFPYDALISGSNSIPVSAISGLSGATNVAPGTTFARTVTIQVPSNQFAATYNGQINATGGSAFDSVSLSVQVNASSSFSVASAQTNGVQGQQAKATITVTNTGNTNLPANIVLHDLISGTNVITTGSITANQTSFTIPYGGASSVGLTINVPASQPLGTYVGNVDVSTSAGVLSGTLTVIVQAAQSSLSLSSPSAIWVRGQSSSVQVPVMVTNGGNVAFSSVSLSANPASVAGASVSFSSNGFSLAAGETKNVTATITGVSASPATYVIPLTATTSSTTTNGGITLQVRDPITQFSVSGQLDLGSSGAQRGTTVSGVIHVQNTGDGVIASINVTNTFASKYNAQVSPQIIGNLQPGQGVDVSVTMTIPSDQGASRTQVGTIVFNDGQSQKSVSVTMQAESMLRIDDINVVYNGVSKDVNNGDTRRVELVGGEKLDLEVKVKNEFTSDIDIQDVTVSGIIYNIDDGDDIDDESSSFDLRYDRSSTRTISFDIPDKLDSDNYDVEVTVTGRDDNGVRHSDTWKFQLEINKKNLDVRIVSASLNPSQVSCGASGSAYARLSNYGNNDQENIILEIKNAQLGLNALSESKLYTDEDYDKTVSFLVPQGIANGIYTVTVSVYQKYVNLGSLLDQQQLSLSVVNCAGSGSNGGSGNTGGSTGGNTGGNTGSNTGGTTIIVPPITQPDVIYGNGQPAYGTTRRSFLSGDAYLAILALAIAVLVGVLAWMLGQMRK